MALKYIHENKIIHRDIKVFLNIINDSQIIFYTKMKILYVSVTLALLIIIILRQYISFKDVELLVMLHQKY